MKKLQIDETNARKLYPSATKELKSIFEDTFGKEFFSQEITDRIKTWDDVCDYHGINPVGSLPYPNPVNKRQEAVNAFFMLDYISEALNEGVIMDYDNGNQKKWYPWFEKKSSGCGFSHAGYHYGYTNATVGARLSYATEKLAKHAGITFNDVYNKFLTK